MRNPPEFTPDPYRTLGLDPGASMAEVKRAYRRLAKAFHPDSAGEAALPRFLAIHAAYEHIRTGRPLPAARPPQPTSPAAEPWRADPERARAARERARAARAGRAGMGGPTQSGGPTTGTASSGARPGGSSATGPGGAPGGSATSGGSGFGRARSPGGRRETRKATLGSTSYDDAHDPSDATWSGASWYGPSTGEYWIVNPREYADPRKHGPDYQSRARRPLDADDPFIDGRSPDEPAQDDVAADIGAEAAASASASASASRPRASADAAAGAAVDGRWAGARDEATRPGAAGSAARRSSRARAGGAGAPAGSERRPMSAAGAAGGGAVTGARPAARTVNRGSRWSRLGDIAPESTWPAPPAAATGALLGNAADDPIRRLGVALVAWPPIGLAAAAAIGEITGCSTYSADCGGSDPLLPWLAQAGILGLLLLLPPIARLLAGGAIAVVLALVPITGFLVVVGATGAPQAGFALAFLLALAWVAGVAWSTAVSRRRGQGKGGAVP